MSIITKISSFNPASTGGSKILPNRFVRAGFQKSGAVTNPVRINSKNEIKASIIKLKEKEDAKAKATLENAEKTVSEWGNKILKRDFVDFAKSRHSSILDTAETLGTQRIDTGNGGFTVNITDFVKEIKNKIAVAQQKSKDIEEFIPKMEDMPQRHLSLAQDVIDLSNTEFFTLKGIFAEDNFNAIKQINASGKKSTLMGYILNNLPKLSKENPNALDLAEKVCTYSDHVNAKFFLTRFLGSVNPKRAQQMKATEPLVESISKSTLEGSPSLYFDNNCKENQFLEIINTLTSENSKPENVKSLGKALDITDKGVDKISYNFYIPEIVSGDSDKIGKNLDLLPQLVENSLKQGIKKLDVSGFLAKNTNLD